MSKSADQLPSYEQTTAEDPWRSFREKVKNSTAERFTHINARDIDVMLSAKGEKLEKNKLAFDRMLDNVIRHGTVPSWRVEDTAFAYYYIHLEFDAPVETVTFRVWYPFDRKCTIL